MTNIKLKAAIVMYNHYIKKANESWDYYDCLVDCYIVYDYHMEMAEMYQQIILKELY